MRSGLSHIKKIGVVTTYGAPQHLVQHAGDSARRFIRYSLLPMFSPGCLVDWNGLYAMDQATELEKKKFLLEVKENCKHF
jgi:NAD(P)H dehydrogenase (quinone)